MQENFFLELKSLYEKDKVPVFAVGDIYMLLRYLSFDPKVFGVVEQANKLALVLPTDELIVFLFCSIPQQKAPFIKLPKKKRQEKVGAVLSKIAQIFCCGLLHAEQILLIYESVGIDLHIELGLR